MDDLTKATIEHIGVESVVIRIEAPWRAPVQRILYEGDGLVGMGEVVKPPPRQPDVSLIGEREGAKPPRYRAQREYVDHACPKPSTWRRKTGSLWVCWCGKAYSLQEFEDAWSAWREWVRWAPWEPK